jgi:hypothetical protein
MISQLTTSKLSLFVNPRQLKCKPSIINQAGLFIDSIKRQIKNQSKCHERTGSWKIAGNG